MTEALFSRDRFIKDRNASKTLTEQLLAYPLNPARRDLTATGLQLAWSPALIEPLGRIHSISSKNLSGKNLPYSLIRSHLAFLLPNLLRVRSDVGLALNTRDQDDAAADVAFMEISDMDVTAVQSELAAMIQARLQIWLQHDLAPFAQRHGAGSALQDVEAAITQSRSFDLRRRTQHLLTGDGEFKDMPALVSRLADKLVGVDTLIPGFGPLYRLIPRSYRDSSNVATLITRPQPAPGRGGAANAYWSAMIRVSIETMPYGGAPIVMLTPSKRLWAPRRPGYVAYGTRQVTGCIFPGLGDEDDDFNEDRVIEFPIEHDWKDKSWDIGSSLAYLAFLKEGGNLQRLASIRDVDELVALAPEPRHQAWAGMVHHRAFGSHPASDRTLEYDEWTVFTEAKKYLAPDIGDALPAPRVKEKARSDHKVCKIDAADVIRTLAESGDPASRWERVARELGLDPDTDQARLGAPPKPKHAGDLADQRSLNAAAIDLHHDGQRPTLWVIGDPEHRAAIRGAAHSLFGADTLVVREMGLPDGTHGLRSSLPGGDERLSAAKRFDLRVKAWRECAERIKSTTEGASYAIVCARDQYENGARDDSVNYYAGHHALPALGNSNVQYQLPWEKGTAADFNAFCQRVQSSLTDLLLAHNAHLHDVAAHTQAHFSSASPKSVIALTSVRSKGARRGKQPGNSVIAAIRLDTQYGKTSVRFTFDPGSVSSGLSDQSTDVTEWMDFRAGLRWLATNTQVRIKPAPPDQKRTLSAFADQVVGDAVDAGERPVILLDANSLRGIWPWLADQRINGQEIFLDAAHANLQQLWKGARLVRIRRGAAPPLRCEAVVKYAPLDKHDNPGKNLFSYRYLTTVRRLVRASQEAEGKGVHYVAVHKVPETYQIARGLSGYRSVPWMRKLRTQTSDGKAVEEKILVSDMKNPDKDREEQVFVLGEREPETKEVSKPAAIDITVAFYPEGDDPDQIASFVAGLRQGYAQSSDGTSLPAPLFFRARIEDYFIGYGIEQKSLAESDAGDSAPVEELDAGGIISLAESTPKAAPSLARHDLFGLGARRRLAAYPLASSGASAVPVVMGAEGSVLPPKTPLASRQSAGIDEHVRNTLSDITLPIARSIAKKQLVVDLPSFYTREMMAETISRLSTTERRRILDGLQRLGRGFGTEGGHRRLQDFESFAWSHRHEVMFFSLIDESVIRRKRYRRAFITSHWWSLRNEALCSDASAVPRQAPLKDRVGALVKFLSKEKRCNDLARLILEPIMGGDGPGAIVHLEAVDGEGISCPQIEDVRGYLAAVAACIWTADDGESQASSAPNHDVDAATTSGAARPVAEPLSGRTQGEAEEAPVGTPTVTESQIPEMEDSKRSSSRRETMAESDIEREWSAHLSTINEALSGLAHDDRNASVRLETAKSSILEAESLLARAKDAERAQAAKRKQLDEAKQALLQAASNYAAAEDLDPDLLADLDRVRDSSSSACRSEQIDSAIEQVGGGERAFGDALNCRLASDQSMEAAIRSKGAERNRLIAEGARHDEEDKAAVAKAARATALVARYLQGETVDLSESQASLEPAAALDVGGGPPVGEEGDEEPASTASAHAGNAEHQDDTSEAADGAAIEAPGAQPENAESATAEKENAADIFGPEKSGVAPLAAEVDEDVNAGADGDDDLDADEDHDDDEEDFEPEPISADRLATTFDRLVRSGMAGAALAMPEIHDVERLTGSGLCGLPKPYYYAVAAGCHQGEGYLATKDSIEQIVDWINSTTQPAEMEDEMRAVAAKAALAACLRQAIFSQHHSLTREFVADALTKHFGDETSIHKLAHDIAEMNEEGVALHPETLAEVAENSGKAWRCRLDDLVSEANHWGDSSSVHRGFNNYQPAHKVWQHLLSNKHPVGKALRGVSADKLNKSRQLVQEALAELDKPNDEIIEGLSAATSKTGRHVRIKSNSRDHLDENIDLTRDHLQALKDQINSDPSQTEEHQRQLMAKWADRLKGKLESARDHLLSEAAAEPLERAINHALCLAVNSVLGNYEGAPERRGLTLRDWIERQWLLLPLTIGRRARPVWGANAREVLAAAEDPGFINGEHLSLRLRKDIEWHCRNSRLLLARKALEVARVNGEDLAEEDEVFDECREEAEESAITGIRSARRQLNLASAMSLVDDAEKAALDAVLVAIEEQVDMLPDIKRNIVSFNDDGSEQGEGHILDFPHVLDIIAGDVLDYTRVAIEGYRNSLLKDIEDFAHEIPDQHRSQLDSVRKEADEDDPMSLLKAREYLSHLKNDEPIPPRPNVNEVLQSFTRSFLPQIEQVLADRNNLEDLISACLDWLGDGASGDFAGLSINPEDVAAASAAIRDWEALFDQNLSGAATAKRISSFFRDRLRINNERVDTAKDVGTQADFYLKHADLKTTEAFIPPSFGSALKKGAPGHRVVMTQAKGNVEIATSLVQGGGTGFGLVRSALRPQERARIAKATRAKDSRILLIDDALLVFVVLRSLSPHRHESPAAVLFRVGLAFVRDVPFADEDGVPSEMFYGREVQLQELKRDSAPLVVYGGRRLGKSSLLKKLVEDQHDPDHGQYYFVINATPFTDDQYQKGLWSSVRKTLSQAQILKRARRGTKIEDTIDEITAWLNEDSSRKLSLIFDEADAFLFNDSNHDLRCVKQLRDLSTSHSGQFRFVLVGLHNAHRLHRDPNTPFGHFRDPICVEPFIREDQLVGYRLIEEPMTALGFQFGKSLDALEILTLANYSPGLIQVFCRHLMEYLYRKGFDGLPPYTIDISDIRAVANDADLIENLVKKFNLTLELDRRYELIALILALHQYDEDPGKTAMTLAEIREWCMTYGPAMFTVRDEHVIGVYLDEMVRLGVLARDEQGRFLVRSPNIASYIGTREEIEGKLDHFDQNKLSPTIEPRYARVLNSSGEGCLPLDERQLSLLLDREQSNISVFVGSPLLGIDQFREIFDAPATTARFDDTKEFPYHGESLVSRVEGYIVARRKMKGRAAPSKGALFYVGQDQPWEPEDLKRATEQLKHLRKRGKDKLLFIGHAAHARALANESSKFREDFHIEHASLWSPDAIAIRAQAYEIPKFQGDFKLQDRILQATGRVSRYVEAVLQSLAREGKAGPSDPAEIVQALLPDTRDELLRQFGLEPDDWELIEAFCLDPIKHHDAANQRVLKMRPENGDIRLLEWLGAVFVDDAGLYQANPLFERYIK